MVELKDLTPGTIALGRNGKIAIVTELKPRNTKYPIIYSFSTGAKGYKGNENDFVAILGVGDLDVWNSNKPKVSTVPKARGTDIDCLVPESLKDFKIGDKMTIRSRRGVEVVTYEGYNERCRKNPVAFTDIMGKPMKGPIGIVIGTKPTNKVNR